MVGSIERIEQEIAALEAATVKLAKELHSAYLSYLTGLGQSIRQQLVLAVYHVCTQGYPELFLSLSYNHRQQLQQTVRHLAQQVQDDLLTNLQEPGREPKADEPSQALNFLQPSTLEASVSGLPANLESPASDLLPTSENSNTATLTPLRLVQWQQHLEQTIANELRGASHAANRLLQQSGVLPKKLPEPVLEAAAKAEVSEVGGETPNLLSLLIDTAEEAGPTEPIEEGTGDSVMHVVAIQLRLAEIEFADPSLTTARNRIRHLLSQLKTLGREYQKKQRERSVAQAQLAWRSTWTET